MEEESQRKTNNSSSSTRAKTRRQLRKPEHDDHTSHLFQYSDQNLNLVVSSSTQSHHFLNSYYYYYYHPFLPLPPPLLPLPLPQSIFSSKPRFQKPFSASSDTHLADSSVHPVVENNHRESRVSRPEAVDGSGRKVMSSSEETLVVANRPDSGGKEGSVVYLLANHFLVKFQPSQRIYHYDVEISPRPSSKEIARMIKRKLVEANPSSFSGSVPAFDGRKNIYSPVEFQNDRLEFFVNLPVPSSRTVMPSSGLGEKQPVKIDKLFRVCMRLVSQFDGKEMNSFLTKEGEDSVPFPQEYIHALDVILRENPTEKSVSVGSSFYSSSMGGMREIGGGAVGLRGFFQSLRPTQQGLALNVDFSITAFHESIGVIPYLQKRLEFLKDIHMNKARELSAEERKEVAKALKNIRVFVCHRETVQRYRVYALTDKITENLWFPDRGGNNLRLISYFKDHYNYDIQFRNLPCLQISRNRPCYLPMELCMICEGQKFLGKLSDDQTAKILKMGCLRPMERRSIIDGVMAGQIGPSRGNQAREFELKVSREMTLLKGRILKPPKLKLGGRGLVKDVTPTRHDRQWNLLESQVFEGTQIERWALISFGSNNQDRRFAIAKFINQLSQKCENLGIFLSKNTITSPLFEPSHLLNSISFLESKLKEIQRAASNDLQLLICVMEKKHKGYGDLKRIAETNVGVVTQCCLYPNITKLNSQFLANLALKINTKIGGCTVALFNSFPSQIPRILRIDEPVIFMGADVTHPHPLDDSSPSVAAVVGSINWPASNRYVSRMKSQTHRQEIIQDLAFMVKEILDDFYRQVNKLPSRIIFFRDGVSENQFKKVLQEELRAIKTACSKFPGYDPRVTFSVVQKRHHTRLFPFDPDRSSPSSSSDENIPPGTVVDTVITHPKEFDFYLCSHWGVKGTSRPTHYHVLRDESQFTSDEFQTLVYNLCYTFVRCTKPVSIVPPAYYAHLAAYRGRLYVERSSESSRSMQMTSRVGPPKTIPLPKLSENVKNLMFYC
ncbi:PREDICTED: protein argonaute 7 [Tarenaya hassleriana]|uniref:protein argonaute 7 n=1 Tax=Tarenaya hassleriana TaxID=28532 RepID=UPI00053C6E3A|nr:PREDICTED: protein argonaute 7 [Tarenaya hassleriana]